MHHFIVKICVVVCLCIACTGLNVVLFPSSGVAENIRVAAIFSETGIAVDHNKPALEGAFLGVADINRKGGVLGLPIELIVIDNRSTPIGSKQAAERAAKLGVTAVIGSIWSSHSEAMATVLQAAKIPMITPGSTQAGITQIGDYIFRTCFIDSFQGAVMAQFATADLKAKTAAILTNASNLYSLELADFFEQRFLANQGRIVFKADYHDDATDYEAMLSALKPIKPDVVFVPGYARDSSLIIRQARKFGVKAIFLGGDGWGDILLHYAHPALDGSYHCNHWHADLPYLENRQFMATIATHFAPPIVSGIPLAIDAVAVLSQAIETAGSAEPREIREALAKTATFNGITGKITIDKNGDAVKQAVIVKIEKGQTRFVKTIDSQ